MPPRSLALQALELPCFLDVLMEGRHPLLAGRDLAALRMAGLASKAGLSDAWARVAAELEHALSLCHSASKSSEFSYKPLAALERPERVAALKGKEASALARKMGLKATGRVENVKRRILDAHADATRELAIDYPMDRYHMCLWRYLTGKRVTQTTALREYKVPKKVLDLLPCDLADNPNDPSWAPMKLFWLIHVVCVARRPWSCDRQRAPRMEPSVKWC